MTLAALQAAFQAAVCFQAEPGALLRGPLAARGLAAYRHAYPARLREALRDNHSALHQAMGDTDFDALAEAYLQAHPPTEPSIRWYGHALADFMTHWPGLPHPALADLARLDWALRAAFDSALGPALDPATLAALPPEAWADLPLRLQAPVACVPLQWAVGPAWHALAQARDAGTEAELPEPEALAHHVLVWRQGLQPHWRSLPEDEAAALRWIAAQQPSLQAWLLHEGESHLGRSVGWLQTWAHDGLLHAPA